MQSPSLVSLSAVVAALALLIPASEAVLPLALPALSASAASAVIGLSTLALVKESLLLAELSSGRYRRYFGSRNNNNHPGNRYRRYRREVDEDVNYSGDKAELGTLVVFVVNLIRI